MAKKRKNKPKRINIPYLEMLAGTGSVSIVAEDNIDGEESKPKKIDMIAYTGGAMNVGYYGPVAIDLSGMRIAAGATPLFRDHDSQRIVGHGKPVVKDGQLYVSDGIVSVDNDYSREFVQSSEAGFPWQASVGVNPTSGHIEEVVAGEKAEVNGQTVTGPVMIARKSVLKEISVVPLGADSNTVSRVAACFSNCTEEDVMNFEAWLKAGGWDIEALSDEQMKSLKAAFAAEGHKEEQEVVTPVVASAPAVDAQALIVAERERVAEISAACEGVAFDAEATAKIEEIKAEAIKSGYDVKEVQAKVLKVVRESRPEAPAAHIKAGGEVGDKAMEAAMLMQCGVKENELLKEYSEQDMEAGYKNRGIGIKDAIRIMCQREGKSIPVSFSDETIRAGFTTTGLSNLLSNVAGKMLLNGYASVENVSGQLADSRSVTDFKQVSTIRMISDGAWEVVAPTGKIGHGEISEDAYTNQASTYGQLITLNRQMMINDDLGGFSKLAFNMGRSYAMTKEQAFFTMVKGNANSFYSTDAPVNLIASNAFDAAGLTAAVTAMQKLTDVNGNPINIQGKKIVVPVALKFAAQQLIGSATLLGVGDTDTRNLGTANPYNGMYDVIASPYLDNSIGETGSATTWYLFADPMAVASYEFAYLNGVETPTLQTADTDFNTLGMSWRGFGDFGIAQQDPRGSIKNTA